MDHSFQLALSLGLRYNFNPGASYFVHFDDFGAVLDNGVSGMGCIVYAWKWVKDVPSYRAYARMRDDGAPPR
jgi:hypothetical protein